MTKFINISADPKNEMYIDAESVTAIQVDKRKNELALFNAEGMFLHIQYKTDDDESKPGWKLDPDQIVETLKIFGDGLAQLPIRWAENATDNVMHYFSPAAVAYVTVSQPGKDALYGVIMGVAGFGREESYEVSADELKAIVSAIKSVPGKQIMEFGPQEAESRWAHAERLYVDPSTLKSVVEDGHGGVDATWENVGRLDIRVPMVDANEQLEKIRQENPRISLREAFEKVSEVSENNRGKALAAKLALASGVLTGFTDSERHVYFKPENIAYMQAYQKDEKHSLYVRMQETKKNPYPEPVRLTFNSKVNRDKAMQTLETALMKPTTAAPKPSNPGTP